MKKYNPFNISKDQVVLHKAYKINENNNFALISNSSSTQYHWVNLSFTENSKLLKHINEVPNVKSIEGEFIKQKKLITGYDEKIKTLELEIKNLNSKNMDFFKQRESAVTKLHITEDKLEQQKKPEIINVKEEVTIIEPHRKELDFFRSENQKSRRELDFGIGKNQRHPRFRT